MAKKSKKAKKAPSKESVFFRSSTSLRKLTAAFERGMVSEKELRRLYTLQYASSQRNVKAISKSELPFRKEEALPVFHSVRELKSSEDVLKALVDINRWFRGGQSTVTGRRKIRKDTIETVNKELFKGQEILNKKNYNAWLDFWDWFKDTKKDKIYASGASAVQDAAEAAVTGKKPDNKVALQLLKEFDPDTWGDEEKEEKEE